MNRLHSFFGLALLALAPLAFAQAPANGGADAPKDSANANVLIENNGMRVTQNGDGMVITFGTPGASGESFSIPVPAEYLEGQVPAGSVPPAPTTETTPATPPITLPGALAPAGTVTPAQTPDTDNGARRSSRRSRRSRRTSSGASAVDPSDPYSIITARNIFVRDRQSARPADDTPAPPPESSLVLTGLARHGERAVAFIENRGAGSTSMLTEGASVGGGRLAKVTLDYVDYEQDSETTRVTVGMALSGAPASSVAETPSTGTIAPTVIGGNAEANSILERLRAKRKSAGGN